MCSHRLKAQETGERGSAEAVCLALLPLGVVLPESWVTFFPAVGPLPAASGSFPSPEQSWGQGQGQGYVLAVKSLAGGWSLSSTLLPSVGSSLC